MGPCCAAALWWVHSGTEQATSLCVMVSHPCGACACIKQSADPHEPFKCCLQDRLCCHAQNDALRQLFDGACSADCLPASPLLPRAAAICQSTTCRSACRAWCRSLQCCRRPLPPSTLQSPCWPHVHLPEGCGVVNGYGVYSSCLLAVHLCSASPPCLSRPLPACRAQCSPLLWCVRPLHPGTPSAPST